MKKYLKIALLSMVIISFQSCGNREVQYNEVYYDQATQTVIYDGKPFTGIVNGDDAHPNEHAIIKDGKIVDIIKITQLSNGYTEKRHKDGSCEYYDYNGDRISKTEFEKNK